MHNNKIFRILSKLTPEELKEFIKFVNTPFVENNKQVILFLEFVRKFHPNYVLDESQETELIHAIFLRKKVPRAKLLYVFSDTFKAIEKFLIYKHVTEHQLYSHYFMSKIYYRMGLDHQMALRLKHFEKSLTEQDTRDSSHYYFKYLLHAEKLRYNLLNKNRNGETAINELIENLDIFYFTKRLKYYSEALNRQNILQTEVSIDFIEEILNYIEKNSLNQIPAIYIYNLIIKTLLYPEAESNFKELKKTAFANLHLFSKEEMSDILGFVINYCIKKINQGVVNFYQELFDIYEFMIDTELIFTSGVISHLHFKNIVTIALRLKHFQWVEHFIDKHIKNLDTEHQENAFVYSHARLAFAKGDYKQTLKLLAKVNFTDVYYALDIKVLQLKCYYELADTEAFDSLINSFGIYLKRNKIASKYQIQVYQNFYKIIRKLYILKMDKTRRTKDIDTLLLEIEQNKNIADYNWILEKAKALKNTHNNEDKQ